MDDVVNQLPAVDSDVRDEDVARLSPFVRHHTNMLGRYPFQLPDRPTACVRFTTRTRPTRSDRP